MVLPAPSPRGVTTIPLLPEAVPEIDANPLSLVGDGGQSTHKSVHLLEFVYKLRQLLSVEFLKYRPTRSLVHRACERSGPKIGRVGAEW